MKKALHYPRVAKQFLETEICGRRDKSDAAIVNYPIVCVVHIYSLMFL